MTHPALGQIAQLIQSTIAERLSRARRGSQAQMPSQMYMQFMIAPGDPNTALGSAVWGGQGQDVQLMFGSGVPLTFALRPGVAQSGNPSTMLMSPPDFAGELRTFLMSSGSGMWDFSDAIVHRLFQVYGEFCVLRFFLSSMSSSVHVRVCVLSVFAFGLLVCKDVFFKLVLFIMDGFLGPKL